MNFILLLLKFEFLSLTCYTSFLTSFDFQNYLIYIFLLYSKRFNVCLLDLAIVEGTTNYGLA